MARQSQLESAAKSRAVQRRHNRYTGTFDGSHDCRQKGSLKRFAELPDVCAGHEGATGARQDRGADRSILIDLCKSLQQSLTHGLADCIDRRVVDRDPGDPVHNGR
jgi:hypothetical protein